MTQVLAEAWRAGRQLMTGHPANASFAGASWLHEHLLTTNLLRHSMLSKPSKYYNNVS